MENYSDPLLLIKLLRTISVHCLLSLWPTWWHLSLFISVYSIVSLLLSSFWLSGGPAATVWCNFDIKSQETRDIRARKKRSSQVLFVIKVFLLHPCPSPPLDPWEIAAGMWVFNELKEDHHLSLILSSIWKNTQPNSSFSPPQREPEEGAEDKSPDEGDEPANRVFSSCSWWSQVSSPRLPFRGD